MPDNYFSDEASMPASKEAEGGETALLPKSFLSGGAKPGDTITLTVSRILDDQVEVTKGPTESEEEPEGEMPMEAQVPQGMSQQSDSPFTA